MPQRLKISIHKRLPIWAFRADRTPNVPAGKFNAKDYGKGIAPGISLNTSFFTF